MYDLIMILAYLFFFLFGLCLTEIVGIWFIKKFNLEKHLIRFENWVIKK